MLDITNVIEVSQLLVVLSQWHRETAWSQNVHHCYENTTNSEDNVCLIL